MQTAAQAVTEIVNSGRPLRRLRRYFPDKTSGLTYYANALQSQFTVRAATDECVLCDRAGKELQFYQWKTVARREVRLDWEWVDLVKLLLFGKLRLSILSVESIAVEFETVHRLCGACARWTLLRRLVAVPLRLLAALLVVAGVLVTLLLGGICVFVIVVDGWPMPQYMAGTEWVLAGGAAALLLAMLLQWGVKLLRVPRRLRVIGRQPFWLDCVTIP